MEGSEQARVSRQVWIKYGCGAASASDLGFAVAQEVLKNGQKNNQGIPPFLNEHLCPMML
jgi:hypothetical protein